MKLAPRPPPGSFKPPPKKAVVLPGPSADDKSRAEYHAGAEPSARYLAKKSKKKAKRRLGQLTGALTHAAPPRGKHEAGTARTERASADVEDSASFSDDFEGEDSQDAGPAIARPRLEGEPHTPLSASSARLVTMFDRFAPAEALAWMLHPVSVESFFSDYWEKKPLVIRRKKANYYAGLFGTDTLDIILRQQHLKYSENVDVTSYVDGVRSTHNPPGRAHADDVWRHFREGCSVRVLNPQSYHGPLWKLLARLQDYFGCMAGANTYLTPEGTQGFAPHFDDIEAFLLQTEGSKLWRLYDNPLGDRLPVESSENFGQHDLGPVILDVTLHAGDLLYFPRGIVHQAVAPASGHSLHVTVSTYQRNAWGEFLRTLLPAAVDMAEADNAHFREGLPRNYLAYMGTQHAEKTDPRRKNFTTHVKKLLLRMINNLPVDAAADRLGIRFLRDSLPPSLTPAEVPDSAQQALMASPLAHIPVRLVSEVALVPQSDGIRLYYSSANTTVPHQVDSNFFEFPVDAAEALEFLLDVDGDGGFRPVALIPNLEDEDKLNIVNLLYSAGVLFCRTDPELK